MDRLHLTTNHHARPLLCGPDVPAHVIAPGGDLDWAADSIGASFFCYRGDWYHLSAFMRVPRCAWSTWTTGPASSSHRSGMARDGTP